MNQVPPQTNPPPLPPAHKLYDVGAVGVATLLGTPVAGSILMALNYRRLGKTRAAVMTFLAGIGVTVFDIAAFFFLPGAWRWALPLVGVLTTFYFAIKVQGPLVKQHVSQGGKRGSLLIALGLGAAFYLLISIATLGPTLSLLRTSFPTGGSVTIGTKDEVIYGHGATQKEAAALGQALKSQGFFQDRGADVILWKDTEGAIVSFCVKEGIWNDPKAVSDSAEIGRAIAPAIGGTPIKVRLVNSLLQVKKEVTVK
jgi:hypothetical protein